MNGLVSWRLALWTVPLLASAALSGCAALDLLGGQLPGEEEDEPLPLVDPRPYPGPATTSSKKPLAETAALSSGAAAAPVPIVSKVEASPSPADRAEQSPARASITDAAAPPVQNSATPTTPAPSPLSANPPVEAKKETAAGVSPGAAPETPLPAKVTEQTASPPPKEAAPKSSDESKKEESKQAEPTPEQRLAALLHRRDELIAALQAEIKLKVGKEDSGGELTRMQQQLRLLNLLAEKPDDAVVEIESLPEAEQEAFKQLMFGLSTWLSPDEQRRASLRNARVLRSLRDAAVQLSAAARLDVRNLRFCESVDGYGWYKEFPAAKFASKQQVILYAEVENFAAEQTGPDSYETELAASYQIFDSGGTLVDERQLPLDKEVCRNRRRDYFLAYRIYLPDGLPAGRYRLELAVEDLKAKEHYQGRKLGEGVIEFSIR
jgi:hypothetical protein